MLNEKTTLVTCIGCNGVSQIPVEDLLDHLCIHCGKSTIEMKEKDKESLVSDIDKASDELDYVVGGLMQGSMGPDEAVEWLEHDASEIGNTLDKAREYIEDNEMG